MCKQCETKPVYEFTNQRKLCVACFTSWFRKKVFYTIRKFGMIKNGDRIGYFKSEHFRAVVLEDVLKMLEKSGRIEIRKIPAHLRSQIDIKDNKKSRATLERGKSEINKLSQFLNELETKHPEVKQAVIQGWLRINNSD